MSSLNFRLYGDQVYGLSSKYLNEYLSPEITKEQFTTMFKEGEIKYENITSKTVIIISPLINLNKFNIKNLNIIIPNETENLSICLDNVEFFIELININESEIEKIIIENRKNLIEKFIEYAVNKIEKKEKTKSFIEGLLENLMNRALNGLKVELNNIKLNLKYHNHNFIFLIEKVIYSEEIGIKINNISLTYENQEKSDKLDVIKKFSINVIIKYSNNNENDNINKFQTNITNFEFKINKNIIYAFNDIFSLFNDTAYQKIYLRYKKLIEFSKPNFNETNNKNILKWEYAIRTVINLQKYVGHDKKNVFELTEIAQNKICRKYLSDNSKTDNLLLPSEINLLLSTKEKVENKVLENKKGGVLNAFSFFFGGAKNDDDDKKELTEEEKEIFNSIYEKDNLKNYLFNENNKESTSSNPIIDKINNFILNLNFVIDVEKIEVILLNDVPIKNKKECNLFIKDINLNINYINKKTDFIFNINDIGSVFNENLFGNRISNMDKLISLFKEKENENIKLNLGFRSIILNEDMFLFMLSFFGTLKFQKKLFIFKETNYETKKSNEEKTKTENEEIYYNFIDNFNISHFPSLSLINEENNQIDLNIKNYEINRENIKITINIKDSFSTILKDYTFNFTKQQINYKLNLVESLNISFSQKSTFNIFTTLLKFISVFEQINDSINKEKKNDTSENIYLYNFNYIEYKDVNINFENINFELFLNELNIEINEGKCISILNINNFSIIYNNKNLDTKINEIIIKTSIESTVILYILGFESHDFQEYKIKYQLKNESPSNNNLNENITTKYNISFTDIINKLNLKINNILLSFRVNGKDICISVNEINGANNIDNSNNIDFNFTNCKIYIKSNNSLQEIDNVFELNETTKIIYFVNTGIIKIELYNPLINIFLQKFIDIFENLKYLIDQIDFDIILCKINIKINNTIINFKKFSFTISSITFSNFNENDINKVDTMYLIMNDFNMINEKNIYIIKEKNLSIYLITKSKYEMILQIKFSDVYINISQHDINYLLTALIPKEEENSFIYINDDENINNLSLFEDKTKKKSEKNSDKINHNFKFLVFIESPKINICFCLNDYKKKIDLSLETIQFKLTLIDYNNKDINNEINHKTLIGKIIVNYFDDYNNEIRILNYKTEHKKNENYMTITNIISTENPLNTNNQVEIISQNHDTIINLNQNEIIIRIDSILLIYYFFVNAIPYSCKNDNNITNTARLGQYKKSEIKNKLNQNQNIMKITININESNFQIQTSFNAKENVILEINEFKISYYPATENLNSPNENSTKNLKVKLGFLSASITTENNTRKFFYTKNEFLLINCIIQEKVVIDINILLGNLIINLSYKDIISFFKFYLLNDILIKNTKKIAKIQSNQKYDSISRSSFNSILSSVNTIVDTKNVTSIQIHFYFTKIDITLIDDSFGSYQPFVSMNINKISANYTSDKNEVETAFYLLLNSYNYISCQWEPVIENVFTKILCNYKKNDKTINTKRNNNIENNVINLMLEIKELLFNLSDMAISSTLVILNNWMKKYKEDEKKFSKSAKISGDNIIQFNSDIKTIKQISNHKIINYTGMILKILYNNKEYTCSPSSILELEYVNEWKGPKEFYIIIDKESKISIPFEKLGEKTHKINKKDILVSENCLSKDRRINICIYSKIIIKNSLPYKIKFILFNENLGNYSILLNPGGINGIPLEYFSKDTTFSFDLLNVNVLNQNHNEYNMRFNIGDFIDIRDDEKFEQNIIVNSKEILLKLVHKTQNIKELLITFEYSIINCLPCEILMETKNSEIKIKKCSQYYIEFHTNPDIQLRFKIKINDEYYYSLFTNYFKMTNKNSDDYSAKFFNKSKTKYFNLSLQFKKSENEKILIIYADSIIHNNSGLQLNINSNFKDKEFCFDIGNNMYIISSKINIKESSFQLYNNIFNSKQIILDSIIEAKPHYVLNMEKYLNDNNKFKVTLLLKNTMSFVAIRNNPNFKEKIMTMIYDILPICKITNLLIHKKFLIRDAKNANNYEIISPLQQKNFNFFNKGRENCELLLCLQNTTNNECTPLIPFKFTQYGLFSFCTGDSMFNLEINESDTVGIMNIFVVETTLYNGKIVIENLIDLELTIYQENFEKYAQIVSPKEKKVLKIYDNKNNNYFFKVKINDKSFRFSFNSLKEEEQKFAIDNIIIFVKESNGIKMKLTFYKKNNICKLKTNILYCFINLKIDQIYISLIGDNEYKTENLKSYKRNEFLLFNLSKFNCDYKIEQHTDLLNKEKIYLQLTLEKCCLYNQGSIYGKYSTVFKNISSPLLCFVSDIVYYKNCNVSKINKLYLNCGKLQLGIDPFFIEEIVNFMENIFYRMEINNFNVDEIFNKRDRDKEIKELFDNYNKHNTIYYGSGFSFPSIDITFELTKYGLTKLLEEKVGCSEFFIWLCNGLVGRMQNIFMNGFNISKYYGSLNSILFRIINNYNVELSSEITKLGLNGFLGQIKQLLQINISDDNDWRCTDVQKNRIRPTRAFYGEYKYFKIYNKDDADYFDIINKKYNLVNNKLYCVKLIKDKKYVYLFTNKSLFVLNEKGLGMIFNIEYINVKNVDIKNNNVIVFYSGGNNIEICCWNKEITEKVVKSLKEEITKFSVK